jgi:riboflavin-specific deaminase-like protein
MGTGEEPARSGAQGTAPALQRLLPAGEAATPLQIAEELELAASAHTRAKRPYVVLNMISTADGRASIGGRSGPIGGRADRELFHALRAVADAVMAGAGTVRTERYGRIIAAEATRHRRREHGWREEPLACVVSARLALPADLPLLATPQAQVVIITSSLASLDGVAAQVQYVRAERQGMVDLSAALAELHDRCGVRLLLCEGGPHLNAHLLAAGLVDELFLTLAPKLAGGDGPVGGEALRIVAGPALEPPVELELVGVLQSDSELFLRYGVRA